MRIVFMGTAEFGVPALEMLVREGRAPSLVVTGPDQPAGRGRKVSPSPVKSAAERLGLPIVQPEALKDTVFITQLRALEPDIIIVVAFRILPPEVFSLATQGSFNLHASLLPKYRGPAPIQWALINGETETGVTTFFLDRTVDTGNIVLQKRLAIGENETAGELYKRLSALGTETILETVHLIESGPVSVQPQDGSIATPAPKIFKENCRIDWTKPARQVHNFIRGVSPRPGAFTHCGGTQIKIYRTRMGHDHGNKAPGTVFVKDDAMFVATREGIVEIVELQQEGRKALSAAEFLRGNRGALDQFS